MRLDRNHIKKFLAEGYAPDYTTLYHGTTRDKAETIEDQGFDMSFAGSKAGDAMPGISFSINKDTALEHAFWAMSKAMDQGAALVMVDPDELTIAPGSEYHRLWDELDSSNAALESIKATGEYDAVELFNLETGDGIEEMEVLVFDPDSIMADWIEELDPDDYEDIADEYLNLW